MTVRLGVARLFISLGGLVLLATACGGPAHLADPFTAQPLAHATVVLDSVDCDTGPESCARYVVLKPIGESQAQLLAQVRAFMTKTVGWTLRRHAPKSAARYGQAYNGPTSYNGNDYGGYIDTASTELTEWQREHFTSGIHPPVKAEKDAQQAMQQTADGVFVELNGSTCGSLAHCQGG